MLRTEAVVADEARSAIALVERRLGASRTFQKAKVFEDGELRFNVSSDARGRGDDGRRNQPEIVMSLQSRQRRNASGAGGLSRRTLWRGDRPDQPPDPEAVAS